MRALVAALMAGACAATGCTGDEHAGRRTAPPTTTRIEVGPLDDVYATTGLSCGQLGPDVRSIDDLPVEAVGCLRQALDAGAPAHLRWTLGTWQVTGPATLDLVHDTRRDRFGPQEVRRYWCTVTEALPKATLPGVGGPGTSCDDGEVLGGR